MFDAHEGFSTFRIVWSPSSGSNDGAPVVGPMRIPGRFRERYETFCVCAGHVLALKRGFRLKPKDDVYRGAGSRTRGEAILKGSTTMNRGGRLSLERPTNAYETASYRGEKTRTGRESTGSQARVLFGRSGHLSTHWKNKKFKTVFK